MEWIERIVRFVVSQMICIPFFKRPFQDLSHPQAYGMKNTENLRLAVNDNQEIGAWFMLPTTPAGKSDGNKGEIPHSSNSDKQKVVLYLHGNAETRSQYHRRALYRIFQDMGLHVLAIDYRGYGDSSWVSPSQTSMVEDAKVALEWLQNHSQSDAQLFVWGHSLGTGVTSKLCSLTSEDSNFGKVSGYILEAPFNCMLDEVQSFKLSRLLPLLGLDVRKILHNADMTFDNSKNLELCRDKNILILHAEDDSVIPFELASSLVHQLSAHGVPVTFKPFSKGERLDHDGIFKSKELISICETFFRSCSETVK